MSECHRTPGKECYWSITGYCGLTNEIEVDESGIVEGNLSEVTRMSIGLNHMQGIRLHREGGDDDFLHRIATTLGSYGEAAEGHWYCTTPNGLFGNLGNHQVIEHGDGTITVSPSILVTMRRTNDPPDYSKEWHGFIERGIWREC